MKEKKLETKKILAYTLVLLLVTSIRVLGTNFTSKADAVEHETVRVGYYNVANFQEIKEDGSYSGYSYDYYMQIQKYTRWNYEFVEASYSECYKMLLNGEIDIICGLTSTPQRQEQMHMSKYSVSNSQNKLYTRLDNDTLFYESYDTFDGCKVAVMKGMLTTELVTYGEEHGFSTEVVEYTSLKEMEAALVSGEVDMVMASSISDAIDTKIIARMDKIPMYYATTKGKPEIAEALDNALHKIVDNNPDFNTQMSEKYMISGANATATFTREELSYIQSGEDVYVIVNQNWAPITWYDQETGEYKGIFIDVLNRIKEYSKLNLIICTEAEFNEVVKKNPEAELNVLAILADDNNWAMQQNVMMSNHVADSSVVMVAKRGVNKQQLADDVVIALPKGFYIGYAMRDVLEDKEIKYYDSVQECLDAVNTGKVNVTYINEIVATYYLSMLEYSELFATGNSGYYENLAFAVNKDSDVPLLSIIDKSLLCIGINEIEQIIIENSIAEQRFSFKGLYYSNPTLVITAVIISAILLSGVILIIVVIISRKKRMEIELAKEFETSNARSEFFMMISHELRTPLNAIVGYLDLVVEDCKKRGIEMEYIKRSQNAAKQLSDIAGDMLDYTRISSDSVEMHQELFDLKEIIINVDQNLVLKAVAKKIDYRFTIDNISHEYVIGDQLRVAQILQNLLSNAVKFTDAGGKVEANVTENVLENGIVQLKFTCRDTGKGMSEEFMEKVCAPFNQSDNSYSRTHGGLGLGLYLTKYFVDAMEGTLKVESTLGKGSTFTVTLPMKRPNSEQILENDIDCSHVRAIVGGTNTEDNMKLKNLLKRLKIKCDIVVDSEKLIKRIKSRMGGDYEYSLCIIDENMLAGEYPVLDKVANLEHAPIIFAITSNTQRIDELSADEKVCQVMYKPLFQSVLFDAVMNTFGEYKVEENYSKTEDFTGIHAMIVEDNMVNADILTRVLKKVNVDVTVCENGKIAVDTFEDSAEDRFQIIFMDIQMPVMSGYEAAQAIRKSNHNQGKVIPIVAVSANAFPEDIEKSMKVGMNEHLSKPVDAQKLYAVIKKYCIKADGSQ